MRVESVHARLGAGRRGTCGTRASCRVSELGSSRAGPAGPIGPGRAAFGEAIRADDGGLGMQFQRTKLTVYLTRIR